MRTTIRVYPHRIGDLFGEGCFDKEVGKKLPFEIEPTVKVQATLTSYQVVDNGRAVDLELEV